MEIKETVFGIIAKYANKEELKMEDNLRDDLWFDSLDCVQVIMDVEKVFNLTVPDEEAEKCRIVSDVVELVENHVKDKK